jgi:hypothetical protein
MDWPGMYGAASSVSHGSTQRKLGKSRAAEENTSSRAEETTDSLKVAQNEFSRTCR